MNELIKIAPSIKFEAEVFEEKLKKIISDSDNFLKDYLLDFLFSNPKRLRPVFVFLFAKILKIDDKKVNLIALSDELIHSASLIHDDIIDEAKTRRSLPSIYEKYNSKIAVLEGDYLLTIALEILSDCPNKIIKIFSKKIKETLLGELNQNSNLNKIRLEEEYINKTLLKTTSLFLVGLESLFCLKDIDEEIKNNLYNFTKNYSIAFQIKNDIDNIKSQNSSDIKCGNYTLPVIYFCIEKNLKEFNFDEFDKDKEKFILKSSKKVEEYKILAINYLDKIENSIYKDELKKISEFTLRS